MKKIIFNILLLAVTLTGCQKQPKQVPESPSYKATKATFEQSDKKIGEFLDQLDSPETSQEARTQILCKDYPAEYKNEYMPALLQLEPHAYTQGKLLAELKSALDYYKNKFEIKC